VNFILILFGAIGTVLIAVRIMRRVQETRARKGATAHSGRAHRPQQAAAHAHIVWAEPAHILRLIDGGAEPVIFRLILDEAYRRGPSVFRGEIVVTLEELEATVPWIPMASRIVVHHGAGIDAALAREIAAHANGRDVMLLAGMLPAPVEERPKIAGMQRMTSG